jgi:hypothetical protein
MLVLVRLIEFNHIGVVLSFQTIDLCAQKIHFFSNFLLVNGLYRKKFGGIIPELGLPDETKEALANVGLINSINPVNLLFRSCQLIKSLRNPLMLLKIVLRYNVLVPGINSILLFFPNI